MKLLLAVTCFFLLMSCSDPGVDQGECPITVDAVAIIDSIKQGETTYYLVHRVAGWSDKTEILELYNNKPVFDHCSRSNIEPIFGDSLELDRPVSHVYLNIKDQVLEIEYKAVTQSLYSNENLKLELR